MPWKHSRSRTPVCGISAINRPNTVAAEVHLQLDPEPETLQYFNSASDTSKTSDLYESITGTVYSRFYNASTPNHDSVTNISDTVMGVY